MVERDVVIRLSSKMISYIYSSPSADEIISVEVERTWFIGSTAISINTYDYCGGDE